MVAWHEGDGALMGVDIDVDPGARGDGHVVVGREVRHGKTLDVAQLHEVDQACRTETF